VYPTASPLDDRVFIVNSRARLALRRFDRSEDRWVSDFSQLGSAEHLDFTADGEWVVWVTYPEGALWRARVDGTERLELRRAGSGRAFKPGWSPDGRRIVFEWSQNGGPQKPFVILAEGGRPGPIPSREGEGVQDTCWLSDGSVVFGYSNPALGIQRVDLDTGVSTTVPGSEGLTSPRCGPGGLILAAEYPGSGSTHILDPEEDGWSELPIGPGDLGWADFASDGRTVFGLGGGLAAIHALDLATHELSVVAGIDAGMPGGYYSQWFGLAPDDSPLYLADVSGWDLYALEMEMP
jgi:dipeptidyl aminopeptidase/acylaminoacyl peptidase